MKKHSLLSFAFSLAVVVGALHLIAEVSYFYWTIFWFDIIMHLLGGISVGLAALWFISHPKFFESHLSAPLAKFFAVLLAVLCVSFLWEVLEHATGTAKALEGYLLDTIVDTSAALLGASMAYLFGARFLGTKTTSDSKENF